MCGGAAAVAAHEARAPLPMVLLLVASSCGLAEGSLARCCALVAAVGGGVEAAAAHGVRAAPPMPLLVASSCGLVEGSPRAEARAPPPRAAARRLATAPERHAERVAVAERRIERVAERKLPL